jgi:SAM-dependent methyltransferase
VGEGSADREFDGEIDEWEVHAGWWAERFTEGADVEYEEQILPLLAAELAGSERVLDIGCGEGQVSRLAARGGSTAIGVDAAWNQVSLAHGRGGGPAYVRADAPSLPFASHSFDAAVSCLVLEHLDALETVATEVARALRPGGRLCCVLNHPLTQTPGSGLIDDHTVDPPERYWRVGPYLVEQAGDEQVGGGVVLRFVHRPLSRYVNAFADAGLLVERMIEPAPTGGGDAVGPDATGVPRLLYLRFGNVHADG